MPECRGGDDGTDPMKIVDTQTAKYAPSALDDLRRDWDGWSDWERLTVRALAVSSMLFAALYLGFSVMALV
jgi:hypothetical protein